jgi:hypothetical protein
VHEAAGAVAAPAWRETAGAALLAAAAAFVGTWGLVQGSSAAAAGFGAMAAAWLLSLGRSSLPSAGAALLFLLPAALTAASSLADGRPDAASRGGLQLAGMGAGLLVAYALCRCPPAPAQAARWLRASAVAATAAAVAAIADTLAGHPVSAWITGRVEPNVFNRGTAFAAILSFALAAAVGGRAGAVVVSAVAACAFVGQSSTAAAAAAAGVSAWALVRLLGAPALRAMAGAAAVATLVAPVAVLLPHVGALEFIPASWQHRAAIWQASTERALAAMPLGTGWRPAMPDVTFERAGHVLTAGFTHPHSAQVQLFLELGLPGILLGAAAVVAAASCAARLPPELRAPAAGAWAAAVAVAAFGFDLWSDAMWAVWGLTAWAFAALAAGRQPASPGPTSSVSS